MMTPDEMPAYWRQDGQGHQQAEARGPACVVVKCDLTDAKSLSAWFVNHVFGIPTCTHYDSETLSLYCGDAGSGWRSMQSIVLAHVEANR
jgi:hypothetical protein